MAKENDLKGRRKAGIPGDKYVVQIKGTQYYVIDTGMRVVVGGPYRDRETAQKRADALERTAGRY